MARLPGGRDDPGHLADDFSRGWPGPLYFSMGGQSARRILIRWAPHTTSSTAMASTTTSLARWTKAREAEQRRLRGFRGNLLDGNPLDLVSNPTATTLLKGGTSTQRPPLWREPQGSNAFLRVNESTRHGSALSLPCWFHEQPATLLSQKGWVPATDPGGFRRGPRASPSRGMS